MLVSLAMSDTGIAWCADRIFIPYNDQLYSLNAQDGTGLTVIANDSNGVFTENPVCSPDGKYVFYDQQNLQNIVTGINIGNIFTVPVDGGTS
jgi:hypothetical protein